MPLAPSCRFVRRCRRAIALLPRLLSATQLVAEEPDLSWIDREAVASRMAFYLTERAERPQVVLIKLAIDVADDDALRLYAEFCFDACDT